MGTPGGRAAGSGGEDPGAAAEEYHRRLTEEIARERLQSRGTAHVPANREQARIEISEEQRARYASRPRTRRWRALEKIDENIDKLHQRHAEAIAGFRRRRRTSGRRPSRTPRSLAAWLAGGRSGSATIGSWRLSRGASPSLRLGQRHPTEPRGGALSGAEVATVERQSSSRTVRQASNMRRTSAPEIAAAALRRAPAASGVGRDPWDSGQAARSRRSHFANARNIASTF